MARSDFEAEDGGGTAQFAFSEKSIRMAFVRCVSQFFLFRIKTLKLLITRKVYGILMVQLAITVGLICLFIYQKEISEFSNEHPELAWSALGATFILIIILTCCKDVRRRSPLNIILLLLFTICEGVVLGSISALYEVVNQHRKRFIFRLLIF